MRNEPPDYRPHGDDNGTEMTQGEPEARSRIWFWRTWTLIGVFALLWAIEHVLAEPLRLVLPALVLAGVIVYLVNPVVDWFARRGMHRVVGTTLAYLLVGAVGFGLAALVLPPVARQTAELVDRIPDMAVAVQDAVNRQLARFGIDQSVALDPQASETQTAFQQFVEDNSEQLFGLLRGAGSLVAGVMAGLLAIVLAPVLAFYALVDLPRLSEGVRRLLPPASRSEVVDVSKRILSTVGDYIRGQLLVALFVAVATAAGLALIDLPFWALVGGLAGVGNLIPFVGPFVGGVIGATVGLTLGNGLGHAVAVVVVMVVVQQVDNHVITPQVLSRTVHVHPISIILALTVAGSLFGLLGMLVAIPVLAAAKLLIMYVLVTRVPSMAHLAGDGPAVIDGVPVTPARDTRLVAMGRELRHAWERRKGRTGDGPTGDAPPDGSTADP